MELNCNLFRKETYMAFCGRCGTPLDGGKFCPNCGAPVKPEQNKTSGGVHPPKTKPFRKLIFGVAIVLILVFIITRFTSVVDVPCDWCGNRPSVAYKTSDGSSAYVCKECSKKCAFCENKATKHYENLLGMMVFVCNDCYKEITGD